jgi:hypothetical protein
MSLVDLPYLIPEIHGMPPSHTCGGPSTNTIYRVSHSLTKWKNKLNSCWEPQIFLPSRTPKIYASTVLTVMCRFQNLITLRYNQC